MKKSECFNTETEAYAQFKEEFDDIYSQFEESENLKDQITGQNINDNIKLVSSLIFARSQTLLISILKLCSVGHAEDAGILLRTIFENYIHIKYIKKFNLADKFIGHFIVFTKELYDFLEKHISPNLITPEYKEWKEQIDELYMKYIKDYKTPKGKTRRKWSKKSLKEMADEIGEIETYNTVFKYHSKFVHCDPYSLAKLLKQDSSSFIFDNSASIRDIDLVMKSVPGFYGRIVVEWATCFDVQLPEIFTKYLKQTKIEI